MSKQNLTSTIQKDFRASVSHIAKRKKRPSPFTIRFSDQERAYLDKKAGDLTLGAYIRQVLLEGFDGKETVRRRRGHTPTIDQQRAAALLAGLQHSRIPNNLNQLAKAANCGTLETSDHVDKQLEEACAAVLAMRDALFIALRIQCGGSK